MDEKAFSEAITLREQGEFEKATRSLQALIDQTTPSLEQQDRRAVEFEIERIRRIRGDYKVTREKLLQQLRRKLNTLSDEEFEKFEREGKFDVQVIDGQKRYVNSSASNLILRVPELRERLKDRKPDTMYRRLYNEMLTAKAAQAFTSQSLLCPQDIAVTYTLVVEPNAAPDGRILRCWLPFARAYPYQTDMYILSTSPTVNVIAPPEAPHRTVYFEAPTVKDQASTFSVSFIYRSWARSNQIDPATVQPYQKDGPAYSYYTSERKPHIDFSNEELKKLSSEIAAGETNPFLLARKIYDWIGTHTIYQFAREYSTLDNIALYTASRRAGDCGQHGMLFIALCRLNGIPARWTTGWECFNKNGNNMHDWCEFYVEPYGWLPADPDMAVNILNHVDGELNTTQSQELAAWLFANMDNLRLTVNSDFGAPLFPPKVDFRSETVDFQRGEVEADGRNLYFDTWDYSMEMKTISADIAQAIAQQSVAPPPSDLLPVRGTYLVVTTATAVLSEQSTVSETLSTATTATGEMHTGPMTGAVLETSNSQALAETTVTQVVSADTTGSLPQAPIASESMPPTTGTLNVSPVTPDTTETAVVSASFEITTSSLAAHTGATSATH